ncbi:MAG: type 4a pilus biogenesis protein PilO [Firmicutes bacterium]|nr:type 4a pilus biogenesis protein PilO [Bacillota bacterium]
MNFSLTDPKTRVQVLILLVLLLGAGYYFWYYQPARAALQVAEERYAQLEQEIVFGRKRTAELREYAQKVLELKDQVDQVESRLLGGNRILLFLQALEDSSRRAGISLTDLDPLPVQTKNEIVEQPVRVAFTGSLTRAKYFIEQIENLAYPNEIREASFRLIEEDDANQISGELIIVMHSLKGGGA